jgi:hypothetical protein
MAFQPKTPLPFDDVPGWRRNERLNTIRPFFHRQMGKTPDYNVQKIVGF